MAVEQYYFKILHRWVYIVMDSCTNSDKTDKACCISIPFMKKNQAIYAIIYQVIYLKYKTVIEVYMHYIELTLLFKILQWLVNTNLLKKI